MRKWAALLLSMALVLGVTAGSVSASPSYQFTVVFKAATLPDNAEAVIAGAGGTVDSKVDELGVMTVTGPAAMLDTLNHDPAVLAASPTFQFRLPVEQAAAATIAPAGVNTAAADYYEQYQWGIKQVTNNGASYALGTGSHNTIVGMIDTGVSTQHPDLMANLLGGRNYAADGPDGTVNPNDLEDRIGHGSHTTGAVAGNGRILGVAPNMGIRTYRVFDASGNTTSAWITSAIVDATNDGVDAISLALIGWDFLAPYTWTDPATGIAYKGQDVADFRAWERAVRYAVNHGVVVVAAAGNDATNIANPVALTAYMNTLLGPYGYAFSGASRVVPGSLPGVVTVSATGPDKSPSSFTNYGPGVIDLSSPGGDYQRAGQADDWFMDMSFSSFKDGGYEWMAGTSVVTPKAVAVAALIIDQAKANGEKLSPAQVVARLQQTAVELGKAGYDPYYGYGMVNAFNALGGK